MWQLPRSTFRHDIRSTLQAQNRSPATTAPQHLLPLTRDWLSEDLSTPRTTGLLVAFLHAIASTCPGCRKEMCDARSRVPVDNCGEQGDDEGEARRATTVGGSNVSINAPRNMVGTCQVMLQAIPTRCGL
ncbi:uncharacterized protein M421DRAFT_88515 [Didymella exigua CBS 183.55]|uniref:Uncharacterized protein n=1 Tax=Didymella exigua CBS 183.55 TaxID=1150837 RepID=A0A6A5S0D3_9PLEO|nr:uncharacterized protein M421DRAFT_88515 [Didymella exigua CBS 183.55]KAF1933259.1 hypothetical protein M421DRAFT_88515 [Didymella exigua CBS 183.55]